MVGSTWKEASEGIRVAATEVDGMVAPCSGDIHVSC